MNEKTVAWFASADKTALDDFWWVYDDNYDRITEWTIAAAAADPQFGPILRAMSAEQLAASNADGRARMARAVHGAWDEYEANLRNEGAVYAKMGVDYGSWHRLVRAVAHGLVPLLVEAYGHEYVRLTRTLIVMQTLFDRALSVIGEAYLETKEAALRQSEARFQRLIGSGIIGIVVGDMTGTITEANDAFLAMIGRTRAELAAGELRTDSITPPEWTDARAQARGQLARDGVARAWEQEYLHRDGTRVPVLIGAAMLEPPQCIGLVLDITERKHFEEVRTRSVQLEAENRRIQEANRLKSEFLANMSHELRTPLNAIIGFSELLHDGEVSPEMPQYQEFLGDILASGRHLLQLINDVLDLAKVEAGKLEFHPEPVDVHKTVSEVIAILRTTAAQKRIVIRTEVAPGLDDVMLDPARFKQVLYNYISNALKFTPESGMVTVRAFADSPALFRLEVVDTGIGIAAGDIPRLFVEFQQLDSGTGKRHGGTGLGLALTKRLVEAQGGEVGLTSSPGAGSCFFATFPRKAKVHTRRTSLRAFAPPGDARPVVLVIEDDPRDQSQIVRTLTDAGYLVETAATGEQAIAMCRERRYAAITLDLLLPDRSGLDVLAAIRGETKNGSAPVIVVTVVTERGAVAGFAVHDILPKPLDGRLLLESLRRAGLSAARGGHVLVVDDDPASIRLMAATLEQLGLSGLGVTRGAEGLALAADAPPLGVVLDLMMPEMDGFEFLERFRALPGCRNTPVIIWTVQDLNSAQRARLLASADGFLRKGRDLGRAMLDEIHSFLPAATRPTV